MEKKSIQNPSGYGTFLRVAKLTRKSTRSKNVKYALDSDQRLEIIILRKDKGYCATKIKKILGLDVCTNTIHRLLKRRGLVNDYGNHVCLRY